MADTADYIYNIHSPFHSYLYKPNVNHRIICLVKNTSSSASLEGRGKYMKLFLPKNRLSERGKVAGFIINWGFLGNPCFPDTGTIPCCFISISLLYSAWSEEIVLWEQYRPWLWDDKHRTGPYAEDGRHRRKNKRKPHIWGYHRIAVLALVCYLLMSFSRRPTNP